MFRSYVSNRNPHRIRPTSPPMRSAISASTTLLWKAIALFCLPFGSAIGADIKPYKVTINVSTSSTRSGPSFGSYPTEKLGRGDTLEVYKTGPEGWLAVRPTEQSFSWVAASKIRLTEKAGIAEVIEETPSYIGSNVEDVRKHESQVQLKVGELVELVPANIGESFGKFVRIRPPSGEFRWIPRKHVTSKSPDALALEDAQKEIDAARRFIEAGDEEGWASVMDQADSSDADDSDLDDWDRNVEQAQYGERIKGAISKLRDRGSKLRSRLRRSERRGKSDKVDDEPSPELQIDEGDESEISSDPELAEVGAKKPRRRSDDLRDPDDLDIGRETAADTTLPKEEFERLLRELRVDLSDMVSRDADSWDLVSLKRRGEALADDGPSPVDRGRARLLLDRIADFEATLSPRRNAVARREQANPEKLSSPRVGTGLDAGNATATNNAPSAKSSAMQYDARGYLMPVMTARKDLPPYQITDREGNTLQFVTPAPGVNLKRYVRKEVGLFGERGYLETLERPHITAERIVDLDRHRR